MKVTVFPSSIETSRGLILRLVEIMNNEPDRIFNIAVSGGSTPALMFDLWANEYMETTPWNRMCIYWVDERCVPPDDSDSNYGMMRNLLLGMAPIPYENVFRIRGEVKPVKEAARYSELVKQQVPSKQGWPEFDIILLGAGDDGHTSSIFPGQEELLTSASVYVVSINPRNGQKRIAMTGYPILNARHVIFLITGKGKADVVEEICKSGDVGPAAYHAQNVELFMDEGAALYIGDRK
jgi:6-phosphogluconolactonase